MSTINPPLHFIFNKTIKDEQRFLDVVHSVPKLNLRMRLINGGGDLKIWFWNDSGVTKWTYIHIGYGGLAELKEELIKLGGKELKKS